MIERRAITSLPKKRSSRRVVILGAAVSVLALGWIAVPRLRRLINKGFEFEPIDDPAGFRRISAGEVSRGIDPFLGLRPAEEGTSDSEIDSLRSNLCQHLFGPDEIPDGVVPIASFSDYRCPYCRVLTQKLAEIEAESGGRVRVTWHEWPLLGDISEVAARAALAAKRQGAYVAFHTRLMQTAFVPTIGYLQDLGNRLGIDAAQLIADMEGAGVDREIAISRGLAGLFGFPGTPALVVGRTVAVGAIGDEELILLIDQERADGPPAVCAR